VNRIDTGTGIIEVPTSAYVKLLEEQVKELRRLQREMDNRQNRLIRAHNKTVEELKMVRQELQNKVDFR
jgi:GTP1/Obg family GTP-binding protein